MLNQAIGAAKDTIGGMLGNKSKQAEGKAQNTEGKAQRE